MTERLAELSAKSLDVLSALPDINSQEIDRDGIRLIVTVWHDLLESGEHRVVVQAGKPGILGSWCIQADGFVIDSRNKRRELTEEERSPFS